MAIVIPTYNEADNIRKLLVVLLELLPTAKIFVVDDNSPDGTAQVVQALAREDARVRLLWREQKGGLASAYLDAFARILPDPQFEHIVTMDADFSHNPAQLPNLLEHIDTHDMVVGSRYVSEGSVENWDFLRLLISKCANRYAKVITQVPVADLTTGFVVYHRNLLGRILQAPIKSDAYGYQIEMKFLAHQAGAAIKEVPINFRERASGKSKFGWKSVWEGIIVPWSLTLGDRIDVLKAWFSNKVKAVVGGRKTKGEG